MGGEITWECIKDPTSPDVGKYVFRMKIYRDCDGTTLSTFAQTLSVWGTGAPVTGITMNFISALDISPDGDAVNSGNNCLDCATNPIGAVEEYIYQSDPVLLLGNPPTTGWHFTWDSCCRNGAVTNLVLSSTTSPSEGFTLRASMYPYVNPINNVTLQTDPCFDSSPKFNESPKTIICTGYPFSYTPNASDSEMDSLVYSWDEPLNDFFGNYDPAANNPAPIPFVAPYSFNNPLPGGVTLDSQSGEITYTSNVNGNFNSVIRVDAYKCGQKVASIYREIQAVLLACPTLPSGLNNLPPIVTPPFPGNPDPYYTTVSAGDLVTFNVTAVDNDVYGNGSLQDVVLEITGGQMSDDFVDQTLCDNPPCATFTNAVGQTPPISSPQIVDGIFTWETACSHVAFDVGCGNTSNIYTFAIKAYDDFCPASAITIATITVEVTAADSLPAPDFNCVWKDEETNDLTFDWNHQIGANVSTTYFILGATNIGGPYIPIDSVNYPNDSHTISPSLFATGTDFFYMTTKSTCADNSISSDTVSPISFGVTYTDVACWDDTDGSIQVLVQDYINVLSYNYYLDNELNINPHPQDTFFNNVGAGLHNITVSDNLGGCVISVPVTISAPGTPLQALALDTMNVCYGSSDGLAVGSAAGGTPGYSYEWFDTGWNSFSVNDTAFGLSSGSYYLVATDANGCDTSTSVNVIGPQTPLITSSQQFPLICKGDNSGMIVGDAAGSWAPYQYHWFDDQGDTLRNSSPNIFTRDTLDNLSAGSYTLHIYDSQDCFVQETITISEPDFPLSIDSMALINDVSCYGDSSGRARLYASGGDPNYTYLWDNGETGLIANMLTSGYHTVSVIDARGCEVTDSIFIPENQEIESSITISSPISCYGLSDGVAWITSTGGVSFDYTYFWSNGHIGYNIPDTTTGLLQGSYYVITRDDLGCEVVDSVYMSEPEPITMEASELDWIDCFGYNNGLAVSYAQGGTSPYVFDWDNGQWTGDTVFTLTQGVHTIVATDARGCTATDTVLTHEPEELYINIDHSQTILPYCAQLNVNTASLSAIAGGGTPSYSYVWDDNTVQPQITTTASALTSYNYFSTDGSYTITVTDSKGCTASAITDTLQTFTPTMEAQVISLVQYFGGNDISCFGEDDGSALVDAWGAHSPYNYQWYGPNGFVSNNDSIDHLFSGTYSVTVEDTNDCMVTTSIYLTEPSQIYFTTLGNIDESCNGACDGEFLVNISGGIIPYTAVATDNITNNIITSLMNNDSIVPGICSGDYTINITDVNACSSLLINGGINQQSISTNVFTEANIDVSSVVNILCNGTATGSVDALNPNISPDYNYSWQNINNPGVVVSTIPNANSLFAGTYVLYAGYMNYSGCVTTDTIHINELDAIEVIENITDVDCYGNATGSISAVQVLGGTNPYSLQWGPNGQNTNLIAGTYTLTVLDVNSCQYIDTFEVMQPDPLNVSVSQNGFVLTVNNSNGGVQPYLYSWREQSAPNIEVGIGMNYIVSSYGTYYLQMEDANGCIVLSNNFEYTPTDLENHEVTGLNVYPNPFKEYTTVDFGQTVNDVSLKIFDVLGKVVDEYYLNDVDKFLLERGGKKDGVYFMEVEFIGQEISTIRLILE